MIYPDKWFKKSCSFYLWGNGPSCRLEDAAATGKSRVLIYVGDVDSVAQVTVTFLSLQIMHDAKCQGMPITVALSRLQESISQLKKALECACLQNRNSGYLRRLK